MVLSLHKETRDEKKLNVYAKKGAILCFLNRRHIHWIIAKDL